MATHRRSSLLTDPRYTRRAQTSQEAYAEIAVLMGWINYAQASQPRKNSNELTQTLAFCRRVRGRLELRIRVPSNLPLCQNELA